MRFARSLRPDEMRCVHVAVDDEDAATVRREWDAVGLDEELEILESPYRQLARPIHRIVRTILDEDERTFVTVVIPEFVVSRLWHGALHNQTALTLKAMFLFEPSVVVAAVPYRL